jgi:TPR repeat protein
VSQDYAKAVHWYSKAAAQGDADGQCAIGLLYATNRGVPGDYGKAAYWFRKAALQGSTQCQFNLATMYEEGRGVKQDGASAAYWYSRAAEQGDEDAKRSLLRLRSTGIEPKVTASDDSAPYPDRAKELLGKNDRTNLKPERSASDIAHSSLSSVVVLVMQDSKGRPLKLGSGFFVGGGYLPPIST